MRVNTLYSTKEVMTERGQCMELRYYLIQDVQSHMTFRHQQDEGDLTENELPEERITYGIRIVKTEDGREEQEYLSGLSATMESVERLLKQMSYGLVTPTTAAEVADDWAVLDH